MERQVNHQVAAPSSHSPSDSELARWAKLSDWWERYGGEFFENLGALTWFVKHHKIELIEMEALLPRFGRNGSLAHDINMQRAVVAILRREAHERLTGGAK